MTIKEFEDLKSFGKNDKVEIKDYAQAVITRTLKPLKNETRKENAYDFQYWIVFMYNGKEYSTRSKLYPTLKDLKASFISYFNSRNEQTRKEKEKKVT